ncbi:DUF423 domain-containing protein [uncultured Umboniibacter sp.]|uniref:DUF423 domain-containing protein n=1 Tax=uncultured Umboniibacter sp. TaxID=1798917 RepID=UPI002633AFC1|nr:DUF423 domain-containing protein [uncultured Umboniibacter sp.]
MTAKSLLILSAISGALCVALGAFGAHALSDSLSLSQQATWRTASLYQLFHTLAAMFCLGCSGYLKDRDAVNIATGFLIGILLFCTSLYALALGAPRWIGLITPIGGLFWISSWLYLAFSTFKYQR